MIQVDNSQNIKVENCVWVFVCVCVCVCVCVYVCQIKTFWSPLSRGEFDLNISRGAKRLCPL